MLECSRAYPDCAGRWAMAPELISRRALLAAGAGTLLLPQRLLSAAAARDDWETFIVGMCRLAASHADGVASEKAVAVHGTQLLQQLNVSNAGFADAVSAAYETGNRFWLWQRLTREPVLNGGILTVARGRDVPLHDHPAATGLLRVLAGELEVWQFDRLPANGSQPYHGLAELQRVSHRVLRPGDTAVLSPAHGNIHALRARSSECSMLDYFIPPYRRSTRTWYEPLGADWTAAERITCRDIPEAEFYAS